MENQITAVVLDDNGNECEQTFSVERKFSVDNKEYLALIPVEDDDMIYLFAFTETDGKVELLEIEDDDEYDRVAEVYENLMGE
jgi:uncharacterized protein YrzB (UPF0473 family)